MGQAIWRFYVYEVLGALGEVLYVGKGSGNRKTVSLRQRSGSAVQEVARFKREFDAYFYERQRIAESRPALNKSPGGNGSLATPKRAERLPSWVKDIERIGSRCYAARLVLFYAPRLGIALSEIDNIRRVAYG